MSRLGLLFYHFTTGKSVDGGNKAELEGKVVLNAARNVIADMTTTVVFFLLQYRKRKISG